MLSAPTFAPTTPRRREREREHQPLSESLSGSPNLKEGGVEVRREDRLSIKQTEAAIPCLGWYGSGCVSALDP